MASHRHAWVQQLAVEQPYESGAPMLDRFHGSWQGHGAEAGRLGYSPPCLTLDEVRAWCRHEGVSRCYADVLSPEPDADFPEARYVLVGHDRSFEQLDEASLLGRSLRWKDLPARAWTVQARLDLSVAVFGAAEAEVRRALAGVAGCDGLVFDDTTARIHASLTLQAPTAHVAGSQAAQLMRWALTARPGGRVDDAGDGFTVSTSVSERRQPEERTEDR